MAMKYNFRRAIFLAMLLGVQVCSAAQAVQLNKAENINFGAIEKFFHVTSDMKKYYRESDKVDGWFDKRLIVLYGVIDQFQKQNGIVGNLAEIGVWQGKSFIPLMLFAKKDELSLAIDCFESYEFNRDNSGGVCNLKKFTDNVTKYCSNSDSLRTVKGDSFKLSSGDFLSAMNNAKKVRMFSIDGCHEADTTVVDMENAYKCLEDGGVIITDDYFHFCWPGVSEGVNTFMHKNPDCLKPFLIAWNKVFFAQPEYAKRYSDAFSKFFISDDVRRKKFFGVETLIYDPQN